MTLRLAIVLNFILAAAGLSVFTVEAQIPATRLQTRFTGLSLPMYVTHAGDGSGRLFIVERAGVIRVVQPGSNTPTVYLNITSLTTTDGERGLLSVAFHPNFETNRRFFCYFTRAADGAIQISEFEQSAANPNVAIATEKPIITVLHPGFANHNGGTLAFGQDGFLYAATGDGGGANDPSSNAQNLNTLLGKMIRIDIDVPQGQQGPYVIPPTNPFFGATPGLDEIFAYGLRNPFRWSFDRGGTNQIWLADVGQDAWEEVNNIVSGGNYGWRVYEGNQCTNLNPGLCNPANFVPPVFVYSSQVTSSRCSITGGYVYRGGLGTLPNGSYIYGDFCTGEVLLWHNQQQQPLHTISGFTLAGFGEDEAGELYVAHMNHGIVQKVVPAKADGDLDGDLRSEFTVYRPSERRFYVLNPTTGSIQTETVGFIGFSGRPATQDYDGDRRTDFAVYENGNWRYKFASNGPESWVANWGVASDVVVPGDYDGDGRADFVVWRPSNGTWYLRTANSVFSTLQWGEPNDVPVAGDFDGDGRADLTVWRPSNGNWYTVLSSNNGIQVSQYGEPNDIPATGDFDGDGRFDLSLFRPSTGQWFRKLSSNNSFAVNSWGQDGDVPVVGDYDGDGRSDVAVWRPANGTWFVIRSSGGIMQVAGWGVPGDIPVPSRYSR